MHELELAHMTWQTRSFRNLYSRFNSDSPTSQRLEPVRDRTAQVVCREESAAKDCQQANMPKIAENELKNGHPCSKEPLDRSGRSCLWCNQSAGKDTIRKSRLCVFLRLRANT